jgi:hypothetical protein
MVQIKLNYPMGGSLWPGLIAVMIVLLLPAGCNRPSRDDNESPPPASPGYNYPIDFAFTAVPDPLSGDDPSCAELQSPLPEIGMAFKEPCFAARLTCVTETNGISGRHEYSRFDPFNCDQTLIVLLTGSGEYAIYRTSVMPYNQSRNFVKNVNIEDPRWDKDNPALLWGLEGFKIVRQNVLTLTRDIIKDFAMDSRIIPILAAEPDLYRVTMKQEGEASADRRFWALFLQGRNDDYRVRYILCWDRTEDQILGFHKLGQREANMDWVGMSVNGNWVLIAAMEDNEGVIQGLTIANRGLSRFHRIDYTTAHADVGLDSAGNDVLVMQNTRTDYIDMLPLSWNTQPILAPGGSYAGTGRIPLLRLFYDSDSPIGLNSGVHISCNTPGYCLVSTHIGAGVPEKNWLDRSIVLIRLDAKKPKAFMLSKIYNTTETYFEETHGSITADGNRVVWASNWNQNVGQERVFLLQLDMPGNWRKLTGGTR